MECESRTDRLLHEVGETVERSRRLVHAARNVLQETYCRRYESRLRREESRRTVARRRAATGSA